MGTSVMHCFSVTPNYYWTTGFKHKGAVKFLFNEIKFVMEDDFWHSLI